MYESSSPKIGSFIANFFSKYLVWIVILIVIVIWLFFPAATETMGQILLFWAPAIVLIFSLIIVLTRTRFKLRRDQDQGIYQYDLTITRFDFYMVDLIIYGGALLILIIAFFLNESGVGIADLIQALIYFILASALKQIFYRKILKW